MKNKIKSMLMVTLLSLAAPVVKTMHTTKHAPHLSQISCSPQETKLYRAYLEDINSVDPETLAEQIARTMRADYDQKKAPQHDATAPGYCMSHPVITLQLEIRNIARRWTPAATVEQEAPSTTNIIATVLINLEKQRPRSYRIFKEQFPREIAKQFPEDEHFRHAIYFTDQSRRLFPEDYQHTPMPQRTKKPKRTVRRRKKAPTAAPAAPAAPGGFRVGLGGASQQSSQRQRGKRKIIRRRPQVETVDSDDDGSGEYVQQIDPETYEFEIPISGSMNRKRRRTRKSTEEILYVPRKRRKLNTHKKGK